jgi:serine/threonine-protein kinase
VSQDEIPPEEIESLSAVDLHDAERPEQIGDYHILEELGRGGMGVVYLAEQARPLRRRVALKVIKTGTGRGQAVARFESERQALALLNHPNIAQVFDAGTTEDGQAFFAMEYVDGRPIDKYCKLEQPDTAARLDLLARVCDGLDHAHRKGLIHRDIKPSNVLVTLQDGKPVPKIIDFGVAKAITPFVESQTALTVDGQVLGTPAYMSPEQARGVPVDERTDVWSLGCLIFESLTGSSAFGKDTSSDSLAAVLNEEPDWSRIPAQIPGDLSTLLARCLKKDREARMQNIRDVRFAIEDVLSGSRDIVAPPTVVRRGVPLPMVLALLLVVAGVTGFVLRRGTGGTREPVRRGSYSINLPVEAALDLHDNPSVAISPDGEWLVYKAARQTGPQLFLRSVRDFEVRPIPGTENARAPFFSPTGDWIGFFDLAGRELKKVSVRGGAPFSLCEIGSSGKGASWGPAGTIVFNRAHDEGLVEVSEDGGAPRILSRPDPEKGEKTHRFPRFLPGGRAVLFTLGTSEITSYDDARIVLLSIETGRQKVLIEGGSSPRFVSTGHIVYARAGSLMAVPFDLDQFEVTGPPARVLDGVVTSDVWGSPNFDLTDDGTLYYVAGGPEAYQTRLAWVTRQGDVEPLPLPPRYYEGAVLSPDGRRVAAQLAGANEDIWVYDLQRNVSTRLTAEWDSESPVWTPDGERVAFYTNRYGAEGIALTDGDGSEAPTLLVASTDEERPIPSSWSPDGRYLAYVKVHPQTRDDVWVVDLERGRETWPFVATRFEERFPAFSPNGEGIAYVSDESGRSEVFVAPFPGGTGRWQVSTSGGTSPRWSPDGGDLIYRSGNRVMAAAIRRGVEFSTEVPRQLFEIAVHERDYNEEFDISPDGQRLLMAERMNLPASTSLRGVVGWHDELTRALPEED